MQCNSTRETPARRHARPRLFGTAIVIVLVLAGCGDSDGDTSSQEKYCEAGQSLESSVSGLTDLDLVAEGTNGLESALGAVQDDLAQLLDAATDAAADEVAALEQSVDDLDSALADLGGEISTDNVSTLSAAVQSVGSAATGVFGTLTDCP